MKKYELNGHSHHVNKVVFSPCSGNLFSLGFNGEVFKWDVQNWSKTGSFEGHTSTVNDLECIPGTEDILTAAGDGKIIRWNYKTGEKTNEYQVVKYGIDHMFLLPDHEKLLIAGSGKEVALFNLTKEQIEASVMQKTNRKGVLRMEGLGHEAAVGGYDGNIRVYNIPDLKKLHEFDITPNPIMGLAFTGRYEAITIDYKGYLRKIDMSSGEIILERHIGNEDYYSLEVSHDKQFAGVSRSYFMEIFETESLENVAEQRLPSKGNYGIGFSPDDKFIGMGSADKTIRVWPMNILISV